MPGRKTRKGAVLSLNLHGLGDAILTLPALSVLREAGYGPVVSVVWPALEEFALCASAIDEVIPLTKDRENEPELGRFGRELGEKYDFALTLDFAFLPRGAALTAAAGAVRAIGFGIERTECSCYDHVIPNSDSEHRLARNLRILDALKLNTPADPKFTFNLPDGCERRMDCLLLEHGVGPGERPVALHPGSGVAARNWPPERFARLADLICEDSGERIILLGGAARTYDGTDETSLAGTVGGMILNPAVNLAGKLNLPELVALMRRCRLFVGNNSGPAHAAAALAGTACLLAWAPRNERAWRPVGADVELVFDEVECSDSCLLNKCDRMQHCLGGIGVESVYQSYLRRFAASTVSERKAG